MNDIPMLLLLERARSMYAINPSALTVSQSSRAKLKSDYVGEHVLDQSGNLYLIQNIVVLGFFGESLGRKTWSALTSARSIRTDLEGKTQLSVDELKVLLARFIRYDAQTSDPNFTVRSNEESVLRKLNSATTVESVIQSLDIPPLEECLDVL